MDRRSILAVLPSRSSPFAAPRMPNLRASCTVSAFSALAFRPRISLDRTATKAGYKVLAALIAVFCLVGVYSVNFSVQDLWIMLAFGAIGYFTLKMDYPPGAAAARARRLHGSLDAEVSQDFARRHFDLLHASRQ